MALWKRKLEDDKQAEAAPGAEPALKLKGAASPLAPPAIPMPRAAAPADAARRAPVDLPGLGRREGRPAAPAQASEGKKLIVGREICLNGEITSCEKLVIEGRVQANVTDCREVMIAQSGGFKGSAEIESAEIAGHFQGTLVVRDRLFIRATGRVEGNIRYGRIEIELGGEITGDIHALSGQQHLAMAGESTGQPEN